MTMALRFGDISRKQIEKSGGKLRGNFAVTLAKLRFSIFCQSDKVDKKGPELDEIMCARALCVGCMAAMRRTHISSFNMFAAFFFFLAVEFLDCFIKPRITYAP